MNLYVFFAIVLAAAQTGASAQKPASGNASIPFVNHGGIQGWRVENDHVLYVQSQAGKWYKAETMGACTGLSFARRIGFEGGATDTFDRFSTILVDGRRCPLQSLSRVPGPLPSKKSTHRPRQPL